MQRHQARPLSEILSEFMEKNVGIKTKLAENRAVWAWKELLGEGVNSYTKKIYFYRGNLHVQLSSSVLRAELLMSKNNLIKRLNEHAGADIVKDIILR